MINLETLLTFKFMQEHSPFSIRCSHCHNTYGLYYYKESLLQCSCCSYVQEYIPSVDNFSQKLVSILDTTHRILMYSDYKEQRVISSPCTDFRNYKDVETYLKSLDISNGIYSGAVKIKDHRLHCLGYIKERKLVLLSLFDKDFNEYALIDVCIVTNVSSTLKNYKRVLKKLNQHLAPYLRHAYFATDKCQTSDLYYYVAFDTLDIDILNRMLKTATTSVVPKVIDIGVAKQFLSVDLPNSFNTLSQFKKEILYAKK